MNIKNFVIILSCGLLSACTNRTQVKTLVPVAVPAEKVVEVSNTKTVEPILPTKVDNNTDILVAKNNWSFTLPGNSWSEINIDDDTVLAFFKSSDKKNVLFVVDSFDGSNDKLANIFLSEVKKLGGKILFSQKVNINGVNYTYLATSKNNGVDVFVWLATKDKVAYQFMCGGLHDDAPAEMCGLIATTLQIK